MAALQGNKEKDNGVNVQVLVRCRPSSDEELRLNAPQVIGCNDQRREVTVYQSIAGKQIDRTFTFDKVFGPTCKQQDLYEQAVVPIVHEVLEGFNCTIFAYGQTGTGKTYTMEGLGRGKSREGSLPIEAGVIPRAVKQIFDNLERANAEYSVKVTFLELYNEEITDLLAPDSDLMMKGQTAEDGKKKLALMEDGKGGVLVRGLEEELVKNASEIYTLLDRGSAKRKTAETLLNKQSSRSHSVFSITIHIKEATPEGEELIKCGKLNLVDLAGSENITRSGATAANGRAREAGEINKSLLTLGRVITALVEHLGHVPYRDSKLTRLLRDSLGGRTKTCIIATVSPTVQCLDETLSTLDYAHRAKNIRNKPEVNQKMTKMTLIKDMTTEIDRLKAELYAAREKNGIYVPKERYFDDEVRKKQMAEKIEQLEVVLEDKEKVLQEIELFSSRQKDELANLSRKHQKAEAELSQTQLVLSETRSALMCSQYTIKERDFIVDKQRQTEESLVKQASQLRSELHVTAQELVSLFAKLERKEAVAAANRAAGEHFRSGLEQQMGSLHGLVVAAVTEQKINYTAVEQRLEGFVKRKAEDLASLQDRVDALQSLLAGGLQQLGRVVQDHLTASEGTLAQLAGDQGMHQAQLSDALREATQTAENTLAGLQTLLAEQQREMAAFAAQQREATQAGLESAQAMTGSAQTVLGALQEEAASCLAAMAQSQSQHDEALAELEASYKEQVASDERWILDTITGLVNTMLARNRDLVERKVSAVRGALAVGAADTKGSVTRMAGIASRTRGGMLAWQSSTATTARATLGDVAAAHCRIEGAISCCSKAIGEAKQQWHAVQTSTEALEAGQTAAVTSAVRESVKAVRVFADDYAGRTARAVSDFDVEHKALTVAVKGACDMDISEAGEVKGIVACRADAASTLENSHQAGAADATAAVGMFFDQEIAEDLPTATTPRKRHIYVPAQSFIDQMRAPSAEILAQDYRQKHPPPTKIPSPPGAQIGDWLDKHARQPLSQLQENRAC